MGSYIDSCWIYMLAAITYVTLMRVSRGFHFHVHALVQVHQVALKELPNSSMCKNFAGKSDKSSTAT